MGSQYASLHVANVLLVTILGSRQGYIKNTLTRQWGGKWTVKGALLIHLLHGLQGTSKIHRKHILNPFGMFYFSITLFKFITMFYGTDSIPHNNLGYSSHPLSLSHEREQFLALWGRENKVSRTIWPFPWSRFPSCWPATWPFLFLLDIISCSRNAIKVSNNTWTSWLLFSH